MNVTLDTFRPHLGEHFAASLDGGVPLAFELVSAEDFTPSGGHATAFLLKFCAPDGALYPQRIYELSHPCLGSEPLGIFLVPAGPAADGRMAMVATFTALRAAAGKSPPER